MLVHRRLLFALLALLASGGARAGDCPPVRQWSLDFVEGRTGDILTRQLLGTGHAYFLFDTGAVADLLFADQADALRLPRGHDGHTIIGAGGTATDDAVIDPVSSLEYFVVPRPIGGDPRAAGALGSRFYHDHDLELDFQTRKINLYLPDHCAAGGSYRAPEFVALPLRADRFGRAFVTVTLDGRTLAALIDTGATDTSISLGAAQALFGLSPGSPGVEQARPARDIHGNALATYRRRFKSLALGGLTFANPTIDLSDVAWDTSMDLILGMNTLSKLHLFFAFRERKLYAALIVPAARR